MTDTELKHAQNVAAYKRRKARNEVETHTLFDGVVKGDLPGRASRPSTGGRPKPLEGEAFWRWFDAQDFGFSHDEAEGYMFAAEHETEVREALPSVDMDFWAAVAVVRLRYPAK